MTAPTDAPVEERHRRAACETLQRYVSPSIQRWIESGEFGCSLVVMEVQHELRKVAQLAANAERDGRASRGAEVAELSAYRMAWERNFQEVCDVGRALEEPCLTDPSDLERILAEELARKGTP